MRTIARCGGVLIPTDGLFRIAGTKVALRCEGVLVPWVLVGRRPAQLREDEDRVDPVRRSDLRVRRSCWYGRHGIMLLAQGD